MNPFKLTEKQIEQWETTREKGRYLYYFKWGLFVCLFFSLIMAIYNYLILYLEFNIIQFVQLAGVSFAGGIIMGVINWMAMEYGYKLSKGKN